MAAVQIEVHGADDGRHLRHDLRAVEKSIRAVQVVVPCEAGDVLLLDNLLMAHTMKARPSAGRLSVFYEFGAGEAG